jgi:streptogramin lyase
MADPLPFPATRWRPLAALALLTWLAAPLEAGRKRKVVKALPAPKAAEPAPRALHKSRTVNGLVVGPGADLRGADLSWGDLSDCDLAKADLRGANCRGARFSGADLSGADLRNAQLYEADLSGARGADLAGAELHPFFELPHHEAVGDMTFLRTSSAGEPGTERPPCALAGTPDGTLLWLAGAGSPLRFFTRTGTRFQFSEVMGDVNALTQDARGWLWCFGKGGTRVLDLAELGRWRSSETLPVRCYDYDTQARHSCVQAGEDGDVWVCTRSHLRRLRLEADGALSCEQMPLGAGVAASDAARAAPIPRTGHLVLVDPSHDRLLFNRKDSDAWVEAKLPAGSRPRCPAALGARCLLYLQDGPAAIGLMDLEHDRVSLRRLPPAEGRDPHCLVRGPDGHLWYTDPGAGRIGRLVIPHGIEEFPLPRGMRPLEIVPGHDGRLLFTVKDRPWIGAIVAVPRAAGAPLKAAEGSAQSPPARRPERGKGLSRAERQALLTGRMQRAEARQRARLAREVPEGGAADAAPGPREERKVAGGREESKVPVGAGEGEVQEPGAGEEPPPGPVERLAALGVNLAPAVVRHILAEHGNGAKAHKSQFHRRHSTRAGLQELLAQALEEAGDLGRVRVSDRAGRYMTLCGREAVGWHHRFGEQVPTDRFVVVTARYRVGDEVEHDVITAYPVCESW